MKVSHSSDFHSYAIYQKSNQDATFTEVRSVPHDQSADTVVVIIDNLSPDRSYEYRVLLQHEGITYGDFTIVESSLTIPAGMSCSNHGVAVLRLHLVLFVSFELVNWKCCELLLMIGVRPLIAYVANL